jgi:hypothetical protein
MFRYVTLPSSGRAFGYGTKFHLQINLSTMYESIILKLTQDKGIYIKNTDS